MKLVRMPLVLDLTQMFAAPDRYDVAMVRTTKFFGAGCGTGYVAMEMNLSPLHLSSMSRQFSAARAPMERAPAVVLPENARIMSVMTVLLL